MMVEGCSSINQEVSYEKARRVVLYGGGSNAIGDILLAGGLGSDGVYSHQFYSTPIPPRRKPEDVVSSGSITAVSVIS